jgi:hypothetical protein
MLKAFKCYLQWKKALIPLLFMRRGQKLQRPIIGPFHLRREKAGRGLALLPVIMETLAAMPLAGARLVGAVAHFHVVGSFIAVQISSSRAK